MIKRYLTQLSSIKYFEEQLKLYKNIKIQPYSNHPEVKKIVDSFLEEFTPEIKGCYNTTAQLTLFDSRMNYNLGYAFFIIPIEHAWSSYGDFHFDLTAELALKEGFEEYALIKTLDHFDLMDSIDDLLPPTLSEVMKP